MNHQIQLTQIPEFSILKIFNSLKRTTIYQNKNLSEIKLHIDPKFIFKSIIERLPFTKRYFEKSSSLLLVRAFLDQYPNYESRVMPSKKLDKYGMLFDGY